MILPSNVSADSTPEWMRRKERGNAFWLRIMSWLSLTLGRRLSRAVVYGIALYFLLAARAARRASIAYLVRCRSDAAGWLDAYRHFLAFASTIHDRIYLINDRHDLFDIRTFGTEPLHALADSGRGFFLFGAHLGSFEVLRSVARCHPGLRVCMAMYPDNARQINNALAAINPRATQDIIALGSLDAILAIHTKLQEGSMVGILADRTTGADQYVTRPFLGAPARFPSGPFRMAAMLRQPVYFMAGLYRGGNRYDIHFELLADFARGAAIDRDAAMRDLLERYVAALERYAKDACFNWFNFYDFWESGRRDNV
jgi:predicted LPLAT superfamily acyltransferase